MANIFARSPYIISINETGQVSSKIEIYLWNGTGSAPATPQYSLSKAIPSSTNTNTSYDISPYIREYLSHQSADEPSVPSSSFTQLNTTTWCNVKIKQFYFTDGLDYLGELNFYAFDGFTYYENGSNYDSGRFLLDSKKYYYNEDATYAGSVSMYLNAGEKVKYGEGISTSTATVNSVLIGGGSYEITNTTVTGDVTSFLSVGGYLYFTYVDDFASTATWTGTILSYSYNSGTNKTTITPNFGGSVPVINGLRNNSNNQTLNTGATEVYIASTSNWYCVPRISGSLKKLYVLNSSNAVIKSWEFISVCEPKYTPVVIDFINKYGAWQKEFFFKASKTNIAIESNDYNVMQSSVSNYDTSQGQKRSFNTNGKETIMVNSGYVTEDFSDNIKELLMSERILVDSKPAICKTKSLELMKNINNHMINYSLEFEFAYNSINNVI